MSSESGTHNSEENHNQADALLQSFSEELVRPMVVFKHRQHDFLHLCAKKQERADGQPDAKRIMNGTGYIKLRAAKWLFPPTEVNS